MNAAPPLRVWGVAVVLAALLLGLFQLYVDGPLRRDYDLSYGRAADRKLAAPSSGRLRVLVVGSSIAQYGLHEWADEDPTVDLVSQTRPLIDLDLVVRSQVLPLAARRHPDLLLLDDSLVDWRLPHAGFPDVPALSEIAVELWLTGPLNDALRRLGLPVQGYGDVPDDMLPEGVPPVLPPMTVGMDPNVPLDLVMRNLNRRPARSWESDAPVLPGLRALQQAGVAVALLRFPQPDGVANAPENQPRQRAADEIARRFHEGLGIDTWRTELALSPSEFCDPLHLNARGSKQFCHWLARRLARFRMVHH